MRYVTSTTHKPGRIWTRAVIEKLLIKSILTKYDSKEKIEKSLKKRPQFMFGPFSTIYAEDISH